jgi:hypothetical protein
MNQKYIYVSIVNIIMLIIAYSFFTDFTYNIYYEKGRYSYLFMNMWEHLSKGRVDIDHKYLGGEAFLVNGYAVAYFLPFPALVRGILSIFGFGQFPLPSLLISVFIYSIFIYFIFNEILITKLNNDKKILFIWYPFVLLPVISLFVESSVFWEAILWALALFTILIFYLIKYVEEPKKTYKLIIIIIGTLILFTRPTYGFASLIIITSLFIRDVKESKISEILYYIIYIMGLAFLSLLNYLKFGNIFDFAPLHLHEQLLNSERGKMALITSNVSLYRIPDTLAYYFGVFKGNFSTEYPFLKGHIQELIFKLYWFDYKEMYFSITLLLPINIILSIIGIFYCSVNQGGGAIKNIKYCIYFASVPAFLTLTLTSMALRYRGEFLTIILILTIFGIIYVSKKIKYSKLLIVSVIATIIQFNIIMMGLLVERNILYSDFRCKSGNAFKCSIYGK